LLLGHGITLAQKFALLPLDTDRVAAIDLNSVFKVVVTVGRNHRCLLAIVVLRDHFLDVVKVVVKENVGIIIPCKLFGAEVFIDR
jgi:hypothetical protein